VYISSILRCLILIFGFLNEIPIAHNIQYRMKRWLKKSNGKNIVGSRSGLIYEKHTVIELSKELKKAIKIVTKNIR